ncbi:MAG: hypothetical protein HZB67_00465, partial [Candidatus Aenigmarchaeota archaeon]|nr:hypothetical protein [Candidatus Aenigmarchaeota archaeon]
MNHGKIALISGFILMMIFISGCINQFSVEKLAKTNEQVKAFLEEYPDAEIKISYFTKQQIQSMIFQI